MLCILKLTQTLSVYSQTRALSSYCLLILSLSNHFVPCLSAHLLAFEEDKDEGSPVKVDDSYKSISRRNTCHKLEIARSELSPVRRLFRKHIPTPLQHLEGSTTLANIRLSRIPRFFTTQWTTQCMEWATWTTQGWIILLHLEAPAI